MIKYIGYTCSYIPVEILSATGFRPYRLLHGTNILSQDAEKLVRFDACPLVRSNIRFIIENKNSFVALVGSTGCDMSRRMFDILGELTDMPVLLFNNPRTDKPEIFHDEIDWLVKELEHLFNIKLDEAILSREIDKWENARTHLRILERKRAARPSLISTTDLHQTLVNYHQGDLSKINTELDGNISNKPRVYLLGSPIPYEASQILRLLEERFRIVGDFNCGLTHFLNIGVREKNLDGIKNAYYGQPACIFKRPNNVFYEWVGTQIRSLDCIGIITWTLDYCDNFEFELKRMEKKFGLPLLRIRSDLSFQNISQMKTRIEAFKEVLCSKI